MQSDSVIEPRYEALTKRDLVALLRRQPRQFDDADLHFLYQRTLERLEILDARAREGKCLDEASEFARWVLASGLLDLFKLYPAKPPLEVSEAKLKALVTEITFDCEAAWKNDPRGPWVEKSELESINQKLDRLAAQMAYLSQQKQQNSASNDWHPDAQRAAG
jgi:hypothetical protein